MTPRKTSEKTKAVSTQKVAKTATPSKTKKTAPAKKKIAPLASQPPEPTVQSPVTVPVPEKKSKMPTDSPQTTKKPRSPYSAKELKEFYQAMVGLRGRLTAQVAGLREQSLMRHDKVNDVEDGTDAFDRVTSLDRASGDQSRINQINTAIQALEEGTYGLCEMCSDKIEKPRLQALPFAKTCIKCQSAMEGGKARQRSSVDLLD